MRIVTNASSNLPESALRHYGIELVPSAMLVRGIRHDLRQGIGHDTIDRWVTEEGPFPSLAGASAQEFGETFRRLLAQDPQVMVVLSSKRLIDSYVMAQAAATRERQRRVERTQRIAVVDSMTTDIASGLATLVAAESARKGLGLEEVQNRIEDFAAAGHLCLYLDDMTRVWKSGRASLLKAWAAQVLRVRPLVGMIDGELRAVGRAPAGAPPAEVVGSHLREILQPGEEGRRRIWVGIAHGGVPELALECLQQLRELCDVEYSMVRPMSPATYLYSGPRALAVFVHPVDRLAVRLPVPPVFE